jgi:hypothetical protein
MLRKIISGGQTGADRAGLDFAIETGLEYGGRHSCLTESEPALHKCVEEPESSCSRDIVDQPKVSTGKESAGGVQFGA